MEKSRIRVLLVCGSGASSGFLAVNIRKAAKKRGLDLEISARGDAEIESYMDDIDCLMVGSHLAYLMEDVSKTIKGRDVKMALVKPEYYATLDGERALDHILSLFNK